MRTCVEVRSQSEYTATLARPRSRHARTMRTAISPRLAMRTLRIAGKTGRFYLREQAAGYRLQASGTSGLRPDAACRLAPLACRLARSYNGIFPCFFGGLRSRFVENRASAA